MPAHNKLHVPKQLLFFSHLWVKIRVKSSSGSHGCKLWGVSLVTVCLRGALHPDILYVALFFQTP